MARKFPDRMSLYVTAEDRANMERLMNALLALGHNFRDARGNPSYSAMMRWLIMDTLLKLGYEKIDK
jgi:hypothetical protein